MKFFFACSHRMWAIGLDDSIGHSISLIHLLPINKIRRTRDDQIGFQIHFQTIQFRNGFQIHFQQTTEENAINYCELLGQKKYATFRSIFFFSLSHCITRLHMSGCLAVRVRSCWYIRLRVYGTFRSDKIKNINLARETRKSKLSNKFWIVWIKKVASKWKPENICVIHISHVHKWHAMAPV